MKDIYTIKPFSMLAWWVACSIFVWPLTFVVIAMIALPSTYILSEILPYDSSTPQFLVMVAGVPILGMIIGACMAWLQRWILRTKLYWAADKWFRWSMLGGAVGASIVTLCLIIFQQQPYYLNNGEEIWFIMMPIFLTIVSTFQVLALRHAVKQSWLWIIGHLVAGIVFAGILMSNEPSYYNPSYPMMMLILVLFAVSALGLITGFVLLFLFENKLRPMETTDSDLVDDDRPKSIWDEAI